MSAASGIQAGTAILTMSEYLRALRFHMEIPSTGPVEGDEDVVLGFGAPGVGKTEGVKQVANDLIWTDDKPYDIIIMHPQIADPTDFKGMPAIIVDDENGEKCAVFLPFGELQRMVDADRPLIAFLDDFASASRMVQAAIQQLILERQVGTHKISPFVRFVLCGNRREDKAGAEGVITTIKTRATLYTIEPTVEAWVEWANGQNFPPECTAFIRWRGLEFLWARANPEFKGSYGTDNERTPRTVTKAFLQYMRGIPAGLEMAVYAGNTDGGWATEWMAFANTYHSLPNIDLLYEDPSTFQFPGPDKPDVQFAVTAAIAARVTDKNATAFFKLVEKMGTDFGCYAVKDAWTRNRAIANNAGFVKWFQANPEVING